MIPYRSSSKPRDVFEAERSELSDFGVWNEGIVVGRICFVEGDTSVQPVFAEGPLEDLSFVVDVMLAHDLVVA